jgi:hypothetical protein
LPRSKDLLRNELRHLGPIQATLLLHRPHAGASGASLRSHRNAGKDEHQVRVRGEASAPLRPAQAGVRRSAVRRSEVVRSDRLAELGPDASSAGASECLAFHANRVRPARRRCGHRRVERDQDGTPCIRSGVRSCLLHADTDYMTAPDHSAVAVSSSTSAFADWDRALASRSRVVGVGRAAARTTASVTATQQLARLRRVV